MNPHPLELDSDCWTASSSKPATYYILAVSSSLLGILAPPNNYNAVSGVHVIQSYKSLGKICIKRHFEISICYFVL